MKKLFILLTVSGLSFYASAQKVIRDPRAEVRSVGSFHSIEVSRGIDLFLSEGTEAVAVSAKDAETRSRIISKVENGILKLSYDPKDIKGYTGGKMLRAYVAYKNLQNLSLSGGSDAQSEGAIRSKSLKLELSGGSDFTGKVETETLQVEQSGGSDITISGTTTTLKVELSGGSDFKGYKLVSDVCIAEASGGSDIQVTVRKELNADASGGSDIYYRGNPSKVKADKALSGSVKKTGE